MDIAGILQPYGERGGEELVPGSIHLKVGDRDCSLRVGDLRFEEDEDGGAAGKDGLSFRGRFGGTGEDEGVVVAEGGALGDIE